MISDPEFPRLTAANHRITSPATPNYNCIAWSAGDTDRWWQPGVYWPVKTPDDDFGIGILERAFEALGFVDCNDGRLETGFEKVALYGSGLYYTHAARQLPSGNGPANWDDLKTSNTTRRTMLRAASMARSFSS